jgi:DNA-directed RNA polymerase subunit M/transcription elongation factor TFIIS
MGVDPERTEAHVDCPNPDCGTSFPVRAEQEGTEVVCPACGQRTEVPWSFCPDDEPPPEVVAVEEEDATATAARSDKIFCPSCNIILPATEVVCVACGYHRKKGKRLGTVRERKAKAVIRLGGSPFVAVAALVFGCTLVFLALVSVARGHPFVAVCAFLQGAALIPLGIFFAGITVANVAVSKQASGRVYCSIVYELFTVPIKRRRVTMTAADRLVVCHDIPALALVFLLVLLCNGIIPGIIWWILLLSKRTNLEIRKTATGRVERFSLLWGECGTQELINTIREVEYLPIERA